MLLVVGIILNVKIRWKTRKTMKLKLAGGILSKVNIGIRKSKEDGIYFMAIYA